MKIYSYLQTANYELEEVEFEGRAHWVLPVVMMVEGVHSGSRGPLLYQAEELRRSAPAWNGEPVVINHPEIKGNHVSANIPEIAAQVVGRIYNTQMDGLKLKAEIWVDIERLREVSPETHQYIKDNKAIDVSIGVFNEEVESTGEFNNEQYRAVATNLRPDHLAILPNAQGACDWDDGCGIRVNQKNKTDEVKDLKNLNSKELLNEGLGTHLIGLQLETNEVGFTDVIRNVQQKLDQMDTDSRMYFLEELYEEYFIYRVHNRESGETAYYRREYAVQADNSIDFEGDPVEVRKEISYAELSSVNLKRTKFNNNNVNMNTNRAESPCEKSVAALIANEATPFTAEDKEWLMGLNAEQFEKLTPKEAAPAPVDNASSKEEDGKAPSKDDAPTAQKLSPEEFKAGVKSVFNGMSDPNEFIDLLPEGVKGQMKSGLNMYQSHRSKLIDGIVANSKFSKEQLEKWDDADLTSLHDSVVTEPDYSGMSNAPVGNRSQGASKELGAMLNLPEGDK